ncbi:hypothetical protein BD626DRAFT_567482 [Schizophyllum amplum]|uniref:DNA primase n=1 Tax=Schizophyllum amplum TaxID=97359 RepID=A0A550CLB0_9AGAR|nr:hypothetical protein BD626DRAFT_567482 [Auriculariopsis ampla]
MAVPEKEELSPDIMLAFYKRLYPFNSIFNWLNQDLVASRLFTHREFAFTLANDAYLRYQSFNNAADMKKQVLSMNPTRFEIGPVYTAKPRDRKLIRPGAFTPQLRELVFDIDMTDYDPIRTCCSGADICRRCWGFITAAVKVIDAAIRDQYGFEHLLWVYSGRRGIHLWISDTEALELTDEQRKAITNWMSVVPHGNESGKKVNVRYGARALPACLKDAVDQLKGIFAELVLEDQDCFGSEDGFEALLKLIPDSSIAAALGELWSNDPSRPSADKWDDIKKQMKKYERNSMPRTVMTNALEDIVLQYTYPRLDAEVSKRRNHLLKAPFCIHPKTGRVCVPVDPSEIDSFDPMSVPTVQQLLRELDEAGAAPANEKEHDWEKTSLKLYVDMLDKHNAGVMAQRPRGKKRGAEDDLSW